MSTPFECVTCAYQTTIKQNYTRHLSSIAHCKACALPLPPKKATKKETAIKLAAEQAAAVQLAVQQAALKFAADQAEAQRLQEVHELELTRVRAEAAAAAAEAIRPKCELKKEREAERAKAKALDKAAEREALQAYRIQRDNKRAEEKQVNDVLKAAAKIDARADREAQAREREAELAADRVIFKLTKAKLEMTQYIEHVCEEERKDVESFSAAPMTLMQYACDAHRITNYACAYYQLVPLSHLKFMTDATTRANEMLIESGHTGSCVLDKPITLRGGQHLKRVTDFHPSFLPRPFMPSRYQMKYIVDEATDLQCFLDESTGRVYDYNVKFCIGKYVDYQVQFAPGQPSAEVMNPPDEEY